MSRTITSQILVSGMFLALVMSGADVAAQLSSPGVPGQHPNGGQNRAGIERNPACQRIVSECERLGFIQGQWKKDNGLWRDCFDPVVKGGTATREGRSIQVPVSSNDIQACRAAQAHHR
jgi:hypothetical protein